MKRNQSTYHIIILSTNLMSCRRFSLRLQRKMLPANQITWFTAWKVSKYGVSSDPYFPVFALNTEIYGVNFCIQSQYRKIRTRNNSVFGHFSRSDSLISNCHYQWYVSRVMNQYDFCFVFVLCLKLDRQQRKETIEAPVLKIAYNERLGYISSKLERL